MRTPRKDKSTKLTRRDALKAGGLALGGLVAAGSSACNNADCGCDFPPRPVGDCYPTHCSTQEYSYFNNLKTITPWKLNGARQVVGAKLEPNEMRITFLGSVMPPSRRAQQEMSIFVEVGWDDELQQPLDQFVFDCGAGVATNYAALGTGVDRLNKVFLCHLHGDHMNDLTHIYCFGPAQGRYSPLYVWGQGPSNLAWTEPVDATYNPNPATLGPYADGLNAYCGLLRQAVRWHTESFSFLNTMYASPTLPTQADWGLPVPPVPVGDDDPRSGYAIVPIELDWTDTGLTPDGIPTGTNVAYWNKATGVKITHFPVIHARKGSIGYKLEWTNPNDPAAPTLTMIYTSDTRPENVSIQQADNKDASGTARGVDVFIHEMIVPPDVWAFKNLGLSAPPAPDDPLYSAYQSAVQVTEVIQASSHTPQGAFGYLLSQIAPRPRLTVATHFPVADDTVACAFNSVVAQIETFGGADLGKLGEQLTWSFDGMVIRVTPDAIRQLRAVMTDFTFSPITKITGALAAPKYWQFVKDAAGNIQLDGNGNAEKTSDPLAQIAADQVIPPTGPDGEYHYRSDGY
jgi:ribonuclease Z